jgi:biopolymer transport protein ExbB
LSERQELQFESNEQTLTLLHDRLSERLGALRELFGVLQQVSGDARSQLSTSLVQIHYPERVDYLAAFSERMGQTADLPSIEEIERLWLELRREIVASGEVKRSSHPVLTRGGEERLMDVVRVGNFNLVAEGKYLQFIPETGQVVEYTRQPASVYRGGARAMAEPSSEVLDFTVDPTRGQLLGLLVAVPDLRERVAQGGVIGYTVIAMGVFAVLLALYRLVYLTLLSRKVTWQVANPTEIGDNPLGRIFSEYTSHKDRDTDTLELKMSEAVMREVPRVGSGLALLKIIAAVAPLMGLLGTVTGMIITFQSIVLFGAGDPSMMAGGISQALVTTVLGLTVAIPVLLLHNLVQTRAKSITDVLEQESVAFVAQQAERRMAAPPTPPTP